MSAKRRRAPSAPRRKAIGTSAETDRTGPEEVANEIAAHDTGPVDSERLRMGGVLGSFRKSKGINQPEFAKFLGITTTTQSRIERGLLLLNIEQLKKILVRWPDFPISEFLQMPAVSSGQSLLQDLLPFTRALENEAMLSDSLRRLRTAHAIYLTLYFECAGDPKVALSSQYRPRLLQILNLLS